MSKTATKREANRKLNGGDRKQAKILQSATAKSQGQVWIYEVGNPPSCDVRRKIIDHGGAIKHRNTTGNIRYSIYAVSVKEKRNGGGIKRTRRQTSFL